jgi:GNAT superfamily N-acetyltransferase
VTILNPENLAKAVCRPALMRDMKQVVKFTRTIWNGNDYLPEVWDDWIKDYDGKLISAELGGQAVGVIKLSRLAPDQWWMEGLRVDPLHWKLGIGYRLFNYILEEWHDHLQGPIRFITNSENYSIHHFACKAGFLKVGDYTHFESGVLKKTSQVFVPVIESEIGAAMDFYDSFADKTLTGSYLDAGWAYCTIDERLVQQSIKLKQAWWWREHKGLLMIFEVIDNEEKKPFIQGIACRSDDLIDLLLDYRGLCGDLGYQKAYWSASMNPELCKILYGAGFQRGWDKSVFLFEKQHE